MSEEMTHNYDKILAQFGEDKLQQLMQLLDEMVNQNFADRRFGREASADQAFGRIVSHTAYHAGQLAIIKKYGQ